MHEEPAMSSWSRLGVGMKRSMLCDVKEKETQTLVWCVGGKTREPREREGCERQRSDRARKGCCDLGLGSKGVTGQEEIGDQK